MNDSPASVSIPANERTGIERECLRQAVHDLRNRLNASALLVDAFVLGATRSVDAPSPASLEKLRQAVRELRRSGRLLDHLSATSDSFATELVPVDLSAAVGSAIGSPDGGAARTVRMRHDAGDGGPRFVLACPRRLPRLLKSLRERVAGLLPDGGDVVFRVEPCDAATMRLMVTASGPRVVEFERGKELDLTDGPTAEWFGVRGLVRGMRGDLRFGPGSPESIHLEIDLPCAAEQP